MFACEAKIKVVTAHNYISGIPYVPLGCAPRRSGSGGAGGGSRSFLECTHCEIDTTRVCKCLACVLGDRMQVVGLHPTLHDQHVAVT
jgi:hypothetical protein